MYFVQDNKTDVSYDNSTVQAVLEDWKCTEELSCICCNMCNAGQHSPPGRRRKRSEQNGTKSQNAGPPNDLLKPLICSATTNVCPDHSTDESQDGGQNGVQHVGSKGGKGGKSGRKKRSFQNDRQQHGQDGAHLGQYEGHNGEVGGQGLGVGGPGPEWGDGDPGPEWGGGGPGPEPDGQSGPGLGPNGPDGTLWTSPPPEADPDFKTNAEFLLLLMQLDEGTRERIGHK